MSHAAARVAKAGGRTHKEGTLVTKWSLNDAPPSEDAIRVRNNQRRHRERVKTYIADLEAKVAALEADLGNANGTIERLMRENEELRRTKEEESQLAAHPSPTVSPKTLRPIARPAADALTAPDAEEGGRFCCRLRPGDDADVSDREDLPAPKEGESTTNCKTAYRILQQQSAGRLDTDAAEQFLRPGYRRALAQGDGCRVQTHLLYGYLDRITS